MCAFCSLAVCSLHLPLATISASYFLSLSIFCISLDHSCSISHCSTYAFSTVFVLFWLWMSDNWHLSQFQMVNWWKSVLHMHVVIAIWDCLADWSVQCPSCPLLRILTRLRRNTTQREALADTGLSYFRCEFLLVAIFKNVFSAQCLQCFVSCEWWKLYAIKMNP